MIPISSSQHYGRVTPKTRGFTRACAGCEWQALANTRTWRTAHVCLTGLLFLGPVTAYAGDQDAPQRPQASATATKSAASDGDDAPAWTFSGLMFGDYYYVVQNHRASIEDQSGFWFRRIYFTYDHALLQSFATRLRVEMNSAGDFTSGSTLSPYVKDAYLQWETGRHAMQFGIQSTPTFELVEQVWGYRPVEKAPLDLYKWDSSRDFGVGVRGPIDASGKVRYVVQVGNGSGTGSETMDGNAVRGALQFRGRSGLVAEGYAGWHEKADGAEASTWQVFGGYQGSAARGGLQFAKQDRRAAAGEPRAHLELLSGFAAAKVDRVWVFARVDRLFDPIPGGDTIDYLPFSDRAKAILTIAGVDLPLRQSVSIIPNVELTRYDEPEPGARPTHDAVLRITMSFKW